MQSLSPKQAFRRFRRKHVHYRDKFSPKARKLAGVVAAAEVGLDWFFLWGKRMFFWGVCALAGIVVWEYSTQYHGPDFDGRFSVGTETAQTFMFTVEKESWFGVDYQRLEGGPCSLFIGKVGDDSELAPGAMIPGWKPVEGSFGGRIGPGEWAFVAGNLNSSEGTNLRIDGRFRLWKVGTLSREVRRFQPHGNPARQEFRQREEHESGSD